MYYEVSVRMNKCKEKIFQSKCRTTGQGCFRLPILFLTYVDKAVETSESCGGTENGDFIAQRLSFVDDIVLLDSTQNGLQ